MRHENLLEQWNRDEYRGWTPHCVCPSSLYFFLCFSFLSLSLFSIKVYNHHSPSVADFSSYFFSSFFLSSPPAAGNYWCPRSLHIVFSLPPQYLLSLTNQTIPFILQSPLKHTTFSLTSCTVTVTENVTTTNTCYIYRHTMMTLPA